MRSHSLFPPHGEAAVIPTPIGGLEALERLSLNTQLDFMDKITISAIQLQSYGNRKEYKMVSSIHVQRFGTLCVISSQTS